MVWQGFLRGEACCEGLHFVNGWRIVKALHHQRGVHHTSSLTESPDGMAHALPGSKGLSLQGYSPHGSARCDGPNLFHDPFAHSNDPVMQIDCGVDMTRDQTQFFAQGG
jgi:hypothetical protein